jgi:2-pyrone-4,6-dicarboxylate lactonase
MQNTLFPSRFSSAPGNPVGILPVGATDCHVHVFDPVRFPYLAARQYTPPAATIDDLVAFHAALGCSRVVLVQPSVYGANNACLLDALRRLGNAARGIAVISRTTSAAELDTLCEAGIRGVRLNLQVSRMNQGANAVAELEATLEQIAGRPLIVQINCSLAVTQALGPTILQSSVPILFDHFGHAKAALGTAQPGFDALEALLKAGKAFVKLSGPYQISQSGPSYRDVAPLAQRLISANPAHIVWGTDWPHTGGADRTANHDPLALEAFRQEDDHYNLRLLETWTSERAIYEDILVATPARLYGFIN